MRGSRSTAKLPIECRANTSLPFVKKFSSPPCCCAVLLDPPLNYTYVNFLILNILLRIKKGDVLQQNYLEQKQL